jgi:hypothetical protein
MKKEPENRQSENKETEGYEEKIERQKESVRRLEESFKKNPSADLRLDLDRETDRLRYYTNAAEGNPKERAKKTAELARTIALDKAVKQVPEQ